MSRASFVSHGRRLVGLALLMALAGCVTPGSRRAPPPAIDATQAAAMQASRAQALADRRDWTVDGRAAISRGGKGGSGRLDWAQTGDAYVIELSAPITRQSWRLTGDTHHEAGRLEGLDGGPRGGEDAQQLLLEATGWDVPVNELPRWMLGFPAVAMPVDELSYGDDGLPSVLRQAGWTIRYTRWAEPHDGLPALPTRIEATSDGEDASVRLIVDDWHFPPA